jgi:hypothetical protein
MMPIDGSGAVVLTGWICCQVGFFSLLLLLRWSEPKMMRRTTISINKAEVPGHLERWICGEELLLSAGHGGEGVEQLFTPSSS